jgi:acyl carrier protein
MNQSSSISRESHAGAPPSANVIRDWIINRLSAELELPEADIPRDEPLINVGLDSMDFVGLVVDLENWLGCRFRDNPLIDYPTANALSEYLADQLARGRTEIDPSVRD